MRIKDIAQRAGVSTATVSNVLNGNYHKVSQETCERVRSIIEEMGYSPSATARSLASKESHIIGVVIPYLAPDEPFSVNTYVTQAIARLEYYVRRKGYYLMVRCVDRCRVIAPIFAGWNVDGMVLLGATSDEVRELIDIFKVPTVFADTYAEDLKIANIGIDDYKGGFLMGRYLLGKGHRKIALVTPDPDSPGVVNMRYRGFCDAFKERGMTVENEQIFIAKTNSEDGVAAGKAIALSGMGFTAVGTMSDICAMGVMAGLRMSGLNVPDDVSVMGFDDLIESRLLNPALTTIRQDIDKKFDMIGDCLFRMIREKKHIHINEILDVEVVERQSVKSLINY